MMPADLPSPADISTRAAANAAVTAAELPPPGAGVAAATDSRNAASGCLLSSSIRGYRTCVATTVPQRVPFDDVSDEQVESFRRDGFLIIEEGLVSMAAVEILRARFAALFDGDYATGIAPDEVNWKRGRDRDDVTRQICNGWRADDLIAAQVLSGTIEYVRGSHLWPKAPPDRGSFHAPENWLAPLDAATPEGVEPERVPVVVKPGGCAFHHSLTFHGSGPNESTVERRALVSHLVRVETRFHPTNTDVIYSRYRRRGDLSLDESFFPVLWDENGGRSAWLKDLPQLPG